MLKYDLEKLVQSLSISERKNFRLYCNRYKGSKDYLTLFDIIIECAGNKEGIAEETFRKKFPSKSFENTSRYLLEVLTDMLVLIRISQDKWYSRHYNLMKAHLCFERSIPDHGMKELKRAKALALEAQDHLIYYKALRMELSQISDTGFQDFSEQDLVDRQMKAKLTLQSLRQVQEHYSLYELLSYRLTNKGLAFRDKDKKKLNDLILSELSITTRGSQHQFESRKLHLLFQSFFFIHTGEYRSALKVFKELNELIEMNETLWAYPPYDYQSTLEGILDSLRNINYFNEMEYFIKKVELLASRQYPEHFNVVANQTVSLYTLIMLVGKHGYSDAMQFWESIKKTLSLSENIINCEKQQEMFFFAGLAYFKTSKWQKANRYIGKAIGIGRNNQQLPVFRVCRLLHILIHAELDNIDYLHYEIRAYKRIFSKSGKAYLVEKLIFNVIAFDPKRSSAVRKRAAWKKIKSQIELISANKHEQEILKYFNFCDWIKEKLSPAEIL